MKRVFATCAVASMLFGATALSAEVLAVCRDGARVYALDDHGAALVTIAESKAPQRVVSFTQGGRPFVWHHEPTSLARWRGEWLIADGTTQLYRFNDHGAFAGTFAFPGHATDVVAAGGTLWVADAITSRVADRLWRSQNGAGFTRMVVADAKSARNDVAILRSQLVLGGSAAGELYLAHMIDDPFVQRVFPMERQRSWPVEYSRTRARAALAAYTPSNEDLTTYSAPVRDLFPISSGLVVLRNREDVRVKGRLVAVQGIHADRYSSDGKLLASASFATPVRWIIAADDKRVLGLDRGGRVVAAPWSAPSKGSVID